MVYVQPRICPGEWDTNSSGFFVIQTDYLILARWPNLVIINKKKKKKKRKKRTCWIRDFVVLPNHSVKLKENENKEKYLDLARVLKKKRKHKSDFDTSCNWYSWYSHQRIWSRTGGLWTKKTSGDQSNYSTVEISQNTEEIIGDVRKLPVTQTPVRNHRLSPDVKNSKGINNNYNR